MSSLAGILVSPSLPYSKRQPFFVEDYNTLRKLATDALIAYVTGPVPGVPGIAGYFMLDLNDTTTPENGGTVIVDSRNRRWKRLVDSTQPVNVKWFGAVGDGVTDDTAALQTALNNSSLKRLYLPTGNYKTSASLVMQNYVQLYGDGVSSMILSPVLASAGALLLGGHNQISAIGKTGWSIRDIAFDNSGMTAFTEAVRCIWSLNSDNYKVRDCTFITCGAAICNVNCHHFDNTSNKSTWASIGGASHHDGMFDTWSGSHDFRIENNDIDCGNIMQYPILVTGEDTFNVAAACFNFSIVGNRCLNSNQAAIWVNGRKGVNKNFHVNRNQVKGVIGFFGIGIADSIEFTCDENVINTIQASGIYLYEETGAGGVTGARDGSVANNVITNVNVGTSISGEVGSGIAVADSSQKLTISGNRVKGALHVNAVWFDTTTSNNEVVGYEFDKGTGLLVNNSVASNKTDYTYTPATTNVANISAVTAYQARVTRQGNTVTVQGIVDVTPTANGVSTQLGLALPIPSNLGNALIDLGGFGNSAFNLPCAVIPDTVNDRAQLQFNSTNTALNRIYYIFQYTVI